MITKLFEDRYISEPPKSDKQRKYIYYLRGKYKNRENTPENYKWIWNKDWDKSIQG